MFTRLKGYLDFTVAQLQKQDPRLADALVAELEKRGERKLEDDEVIGAHPMVRQLIDEARLEEVLAQRELRRPGLAALRAVGSPDGIDQELLVELVAAGTVNTDEAAAVGLAVELYLVCGEHLPLVTLVHNVVGEGGVDVVARYTAAHWTALLKAMSDAVPSGASAEAVGATLAARFAIMRPGAGLLGRLPSTQLAAVEQALDAAAVLEKRNPRRFDGTFTDLDRSDVIGNSLPAVAAAWETLVTTVRGYPGLGLAEVFDTPTMPHAARAKIAVERGETVTAAVTRVAGPGDTVDVFGLDLSRDSKDRLVLLTGVDPSLHAGVTEVARSYQRVRRVTETVDAASQVLRAGFTSAHAIARLPRATFAARSKLDPITAERVWDAARRVTTDAALFVSGVVDQVGGVRDPVATLVPPSVGADLAKLDGYESLFGNQSFCDCAQCASILGPAAYFVDLMAFVERELSAQLPADHDLHLRQRRRDLWTVELTCAGTNDRVPTLTLVAEILENDIARRALWTGPWTDRVEIEHRVYLEKLPSHADSFAQPFHLGLARSTAALELHGVERASLAGALGATDGTLRRAVLGLSTVQEALVTEPRTTLASLKTIYGIAFAGTPDAVAPIDATVLAAAMGIDRATLGATKETWFVGIGAPSLQIVPAKRDADSVQFDIEWVNGLTAAGLDRMHRLTRLGRALGCSVARLDRVLAALRETTLDAVGLDAIATARTLERHFGAALSDDDLIAIVGPLDEPILTRRYNPAAVLRRTGTLPWPDEQRLIHPGLRTTTASGVDPATARLGAGLGLPDGAVATLIRYLAPHLAQEHTPGFDPEASDESQRYFLVSSANLTLLDRHTRLARLLGLSIADLVQLATVAGIAVVDGVTAATTLIAAYDAWRDSGRSLDALAVATGHAPARPHDFLDAPTLATTIRDRARAMMVIDDTLFAAVLGMSESASRDVIAANLPLFEASGGGGRWLAADLDPAAIIVPPTATIPDGDGRRLATANELRAVLADRAASAVAVRGIGGATRRDDAAVARLIALADIAWSPAIVRAVRGDGPIDPLIALIAAVRPVEVATHGWDATGLALIATAPARLGPGAWPTRALPSVPGFTFDQAVALGRAARRANTAEARAALVAAIAGFDPTSATFASTAEPALGALLDASPATLVSLRGIGTLPPGALAAIERLAQLAELGTRLGVAGGYLAGLVADTDAARLDAAIAVEHAAATRAETDPALGRRAEAAAGRVREQRRDALVEYLLRSLSQRAFADRNDLGAHFLIDVAAGGCATTSRVIAATNAVQEYVLRSSLGLEVGVRMSGDATTEWDWRRAYRVWEANRKVFLWPENYLEPTLRDDKTPLYQTLEDTLAQSDFDEASVADAYAGYLHGLDELANLGIAGAYHDVGDQTDVLHLIGVTASDPPTHYYRSVTDLRTSGRDTSKAPVWSAWSSIDASITARTVSPIVDRGRLHLLWTAARTRPVQSLADGLMTFGGYAHTLALSHSVLSPKNEWSPPQSIALPSRHPFDRSSGAVRERLVNGTKAPFDLQDRVHDEPLDDHALTALAWTGLWPEVGSPVVVYRNFRATGPLNLAARTLRHTGTWSNQAPLKLLGVDPSGLFHGRPGHWACAPTALANLAADPIHRKSALREDGAAEHALASLWTRRIANFAPPSIAGYAVPGAPTNVLLTLGRDLIGLFTYEVDDRFFAVRLGSTVISDLTKAFVEGGVDGVLATKNQLAMAESALPIAPIGDAIIDRSGAGGLDFTGPYGVYLRELFFHIPMFVAATLAARGRHADARRWFHRVFDPTSSEDVDTTGVPPADVPRRELDRVWRYRELRGLDVARIRAMLTDGAALDAYRKDPFNPYAIARRRLTAFQRHAFARYVDNILDWADLLFSQFTRETVEEARMLYQLASELLGPRPTRLGDCGDAVPTPRNYETIAPLLGAADPILIEAETEIMARRAPAPRAASASAPWMTATRRLGRALEGHGWTTPTAPTAAARPVSFAAAKAPRIAGWAPRKGVAAIDGARELDGRMWEPKRGVCGNAGPLPASIVAQLGPVFCVPVNRALLARWDRVEDRLWKIRHCMDLDGQRRELALLSPEIDPMTRVAATALGLSPDDLVPEVARDVPPYRFAYLIERAKGYAATLAGFGGSLLGALERRDVEALSRLRNEQGLALARMVTRQRELDVRMAQDGLATIERQVEATEYRRAFHAQLVDENRSGLEVAEGALRRASAASHLVAAGLFTAAGPPKATPEVNAPWSVSFGGIQIGGSLEAGASNFDVLGRHLETAASLTGLEAGIARRREGWLHQLVLARHELASLTHQVSAAKLRVTVAEKALAAHNESIAQLEDVLAFERDRVTNLALHTRLADGLKRLYRVAYGHALALARLAERAFRFERGDDVVGLGGNYWDASAGGFLAGERLLSDLQGLERRFLETHQRELEIDQPFALSQLDPVALVALRETGACELTIPEVAFDLAYPGHWRRRLRAVRLTIPCVTGPYINVGATLTLLDSWVRPTPAPTGELVPVPPAHGTTIATSTAQGDGGVFELSFRDERYLPFEGHGAVSRWRLELPRTVRPFDYASMTDVIVSLAYTARADEARRAIAEAPSTSTPGSLLHYHTTAPSRRVLSARQDLASLLPRLTRSPLATPIGFELSDRLLPRVYQGRALEVTDAAIVLQLGPGVDATGVAITLDGATVSGFAPDPSLGGLATATVAIDQLTALIGHHTLMITAAGGLAPSAPVPGDPTAIDPDRLLDLLMVVSVRLAP